MVLFPIKILDRSKSHSGTHNIIKLASKTMLVGLKIIKIKAKSEWWIPTHKEMVCNYT